ncbi:MAG: hypothetical protein ABI557_17695, partial [Aureliella sp.]
AVVGGILVLLAVILFPSTSPPTATDSQRGEQTGPAVQQAAPENSQTDTSQPSASEEGNTSNVDTPDSQASEPAVPTVETK